MPFANISSKVNSALGCGVQRQSPQSGIVLPIALFVLVAATILTLALVKTNMISLRIGGASVIARETQTTAELLQTAFDRRNPLVTLDAAGKELPDRGNYGQGYTPCNAVAENPAVVTTVFDCRTIAAAKLPANTTEAAWAPGVTTPEIQRVGCSDAPRSGQPTQKGGVAFNNNQIVVQVENTFYGSWAAAGDGVAKMLVACP